MKKLSFAVLFLCLCLPCWTLKAKADEGQAIRIGIIDEDPKGTNLRDAPSGKVVEVIPFEPKDESGDIDLNLRVVTVLEKRGDWFRVKAEWKEKEGWMHKSVLGGYSGASEDGDCHSYASPSWEAASSEQALPYHTILSLEETRKDWGKFSFADTKGAKQTAWLSEQCVEPFRYPVTLEDEQGKSVTLGFSKTAGYFEYVNGRFGFSVDVPSSVVEVRVIPDNGDGIILGNEEEGITFTSSCMNNVNGHTAKSAYEAQLAEAGANVRSKDLGKNEYTMSWKDGENREFRRQIITKDLVCTVSVVYPEKSAATWEPKALHSLKSIRLP